MSRIKTPENINIASLKKKAANVFDPMRPGAGTPWEDRGTKGTVGAFFKTCGMSMFSPGTLTTAMRRPETVNDARAFLYGICGIWGISALMHYVYFVWKETKDPLYDGILQPNATILAIITLALGAGGCFVLFKVYTTIYGKLAAQEQGSVPLPDVLIYNVSAYALGPSILALIPFVGPFLAAIWIFVSMILIGKNRLQLKVAAAVIDSLLPLLAVILIAFGSYYIVERLINDKLDIYHAVQMLDKTPPVGGSPTTPTVR
jgi:hypothetical protein